MNEVKEEAITKLIKNRAINHKKLDTSLLRADKKESGWGSIGYPQMNEEGYCNKLVIFHKSMLLWS